MKHSLLVALIAFSIVLIIPACCGQNSSVNSSMPCAECSSAASGEPTNSSGAGSPSGQPEMRLYENALYGITVAYPSGWRVEDAEENDLGIVAGFLAPGEDAASPKVYVTMQVEALPADTNLTIEQFTQETYGSLKVALPDLQVEEESDIFMGDSPGHAIVYNLESDGMQFTVLKAWTILRGHACIMTYNAPSDRFDAFFRDASQIISSLSQV